MLVYVSSVFFLFKQKTAYEMRISDWSSDVCSSDLSQVSVVSGLPIDRFFVNGTPNNDLITAKRQSLLRPIKRVANSPVKLVSIERHQVLSEAVAAYFDAAYDANGNVNKPFMEISELDPVAVVDVGGATTDIAVVKEGEIGSASWRERVWK